MTTDTIIVVGSGRREFREYLLASLSRNFRLVLLEEQEPTWQLRYVCAHATVCLSDVSTVYRVARDLADRYGVTGVLTYDEAWVILAGDLANHLGMPSADVAAISRCRDKLQMRRALAAAGVASARHRDAQSLAEARAAAEHIGYPVVLKPRTLGSSVGVVKVESDAELDAAFQTARQARISDLPISPSVLVEEYLDGPEVSVDAVVADGVAHPVVVARKELGFPPYFEETGHLVTDSEPLPCLPQVHHLVGSALTALGLVRGVAHVEVRITRSGPKIIEVNPRPGGDLIPHLGALATGVDLATAAARVAVGRTPEVAKRWSRAAAIRFFHATRTSVISSAALDLPTVPDWLERITWLVKPGDTVSIESGTAWRRLGFAVVCGRDAAQCRDRLDQVESAVRITFA